MSAHPPVVILRGGGDLATGCALRLHRAGLAVVVLETAEPLAVRRLVSLAEAVYQGEIEIEGMRGRRVADVAAAHRALEQGLVPVLVDPQAESRKSLRPLALVDGRMRKERPELGLEAAPLVVGLGPGFVAGENCHAVVETNRGHHLGRVYWQGGAEPDTGVPEAVQGYDVDRVLRAPADGHIEAQVPLGSLVRQGEIIATVGGAPLRAPFDGALRGLIHDGIHVQAGVKIGDLDPRCETAYCREVSDKALAVGGGVLEAVLSRPEIRRALAMS